MLQWEGQSVIQEEDEELTQEELDELNKPVEPPELKELLNGVLGQVLNAKLEEMNRVYMERTKCKPKLRTASVK